MIKNTYEYQKIRAIERKLYLIDLRGGKCERCGYKKNLAAFEFHHKNPLEKDNQLDMRKLSNSSMEYILKEFDKCLVYCANCHREVHCPDLSIDKARKRVSEFRDATKIIIRAGKPKCVDCGVQINYTYTRCTDCKIINNRKKIPKREKLIKEIKKHGKKWCCVKYKVTIQTINRWLKRRDI